VSDDAGRERLIARATALGHARRSSECAALCEALLADDPCDQRVLRLLAWARFESQAFEAAAAAARRGVALDAEDLESRRTLGRALSRLGATDEAIEHLSHCAARARDDGEDAGRLARVLAQSEVHAARARELVRGQRVEPGWSARGAHQWLRAAVALGEREASERYACALLERAPDDPYFRSSVASCMARLGRDDEARAHAIAAIERAPNNVLAWTVRAMACARLGLEAERVECERALRAARAAKGR
jgi:tetratricopeptide (TPR) repeat protein